MERVAATTIVRYFVEKVYMVLSSARYCRRTRETMLGTETLSKHRRHRLVFLFRLSFHGTRIETGGC